MSNIKLHALTIARKCDISRWFPCGEDERAGGRAVAWLPTFLGWIVVLLAYLWESAIIHLIVSQTVSLGKLALRA